jgi:H+-transporting ATPase
MSDKNGGAKSDIVGKIPDRAADPAAQIASAFREYNSSKKGLSSDEAKRRLAQYGPNALEDQTESKWHKLLLYFWGPFPFLIEAAAVISALRRDWPDFAVVTGLLVYNAAVGFWQDNKAANALAALKKGLAPRARVLRDGQWASLDAAALVPGDMVSIEAGQIVPADLILIEGKY